MSEGTHNRGTARKRSLRIAGLLVFGIAMAPLYSVIGPNTGSLSITPLFGTAQEKAVHGGRMVTVTFAASVGDRIAWEFAPEVPTMRVAVGTTHQVRYRASNRSAVAMTGRAIPAIAPWQATRHFNKTECFCFSRQTLRPGETKQMPVSFRIATELPDDIESLTLSYTFLHLYAGESRTGQHSRAEL